MFVSLLQEFKYVFLKELPNQLPPWRAIKHKIEFIPSAPISNTWSVYKIDLQEAKEIQKQVEEWLLTCMIYLIGTIFLPT